MRMWMLDPKLLCRNHLLGEHFECHCIQGDWNDGGKWTSKLIKYGYIELHNLENRHDELAAEMERRGYNHKSPMEHLTHVKIGKVDRNKSKDDLIKRCEECRKNLKEI